MKYRLLRTRFLAIVDEVGRSREYSEGVLFTKEGAQGSYVILERSGDFLIVTKDTLREDFEEDWGNTKLFPIG